MERSRLITFIGSFYIFGGIIILISLMLGGTAVDIRFNLANIPDNIVLIVLSIVSVWAGFLYLKRVKPGFFAVFILSAVTFCFNAALTTKYNAQPYIGNMIYALFVIIATICKRKEFINSLKTTGAKK